MSKKTLKWGCIGQSCVGLAKLGEVRVVFNGGRKLQGKVSQPETHSFGIKKSLSVICLFFSIKITK